jgi:hypothetical protein
VEEYQARIDERRAIVESQRDIQVLRKALAAFKSLQHVQLLRLQDSADLEMYRLCADEDIRRTIEADPTGAYRRSIINISQLLIEEQSPCNRFSTPHLNPDSAQLLASNMQRDINSPTGKLSKLISLELMFTGEQNMERTLAPLAGAFNNVLRLAVNLRSFHVGFGGHSTQPPKPIEIRFDSIFHNVQWNNLAVFGIDGWRLDAQDIINMANRHRYRLRGLRLRNVYLNDGSTWKDVLVNLRTKLRLEWVSLKNIGYSAQYISNPALAENLILPDYSSTSSEGSHMGDDDSDLDHAVDDDRDDADDYTTDDDTHSFGDDVEELVNQSDDDLDGMARRGRRSSRLDHRYSMDFASADPDELQDNGENVSQSKRRLWERWVTWDSRDVRTNPG